MLRGNAGIPCVSVESVITGEKINLVPRMCRNRWLDSTLQVGEAAALGAALMGAPLGHAVSFFSSIYLTNPKAEIIFLR